MTQTNKLECLSLLRLFIPIIFAGKQSSLFVSSVTDEEKSFKLTICVHVLKLFSLPRMTQTNKLECLSLPRLFIPIRFAGKHCSLFVSSVTDEEKKFKIDYLCPCFKTFFFVTNTADK
jgi:hypothetical protein